MERITEPGVYDMTDAAYQADPCEEISLRSSIAWKMIAPKSTPAHAAYGCARLNPDYKPINKKYFDVGKVAHALLLGKGSDYAIVHEKNYITAKAKAARQRVRDAGKVPLLEHEAEQVRAMAKAANQQIAALVEAGTIERSPFDASQTEKVIVWRDKGVLCRAMLDGLSIDSDIISEYKTEGESAAPDSWQWKARKLGYIFRIAFYRRGLEALKLAYSPQFHVFVQETDAPYLLAMYRIDDELIALEDERVKQALVKWRTCTETGKWPGYDTGGFTLNMTAKEAVDNAMASGIPIVDTIGPRVGQHIDSEDIARTL